MADQVTPETEKTPEDIQQEMLQTRESLTEKVEALEHQVVGTVEAVKSFVTTAPETVSDTVKQAAAAVSESVKETFDITGHIRKHPLAAVGVAALPGCTVSCLLSRSRDSDLSARMTSAMAEASARTPMPLASRRPRLSCARQNRTFDELFEMSEPGEGTVARRFGNRFRGVEGIQTRVRAGERHVGSSGGQGGRLERSGFRGSLRRPPHFDVISAREHRLVARGGQQVGTC